MRFIINSKDLLKGLNIVKKAIRNNNSLPILGCVVMEVKGDQLHLKGGDGEVYISTKVNILDGEDGGCAVPIKLLFDAVRNLPDIGIGISVEDNLFKCDYNNGSFELGIENIEEYPTVEAPDSEVIEITDTKSIKLAGSYVADDELRPVMNGVLLDFDLGHVVSSDGHKLYRSESILPNGEQMVIIPPNGLNAIKDMNSFEVSFDERNILFKDGDTVVISRLIEGRYPNYNSVIPTNNPYTYEVDRLSLIQALKRVGVMASETSSLVKLEFDQGKLKVSAQDLDFSTKASEVLPCNGTEELTIGFKGTFLEQILNGISGDVVRCELSDPGRAGIFKGETDEVFLLMPMVL